jgi:hypothetical protein
MNFGGLFDPERGFDLIVAFSGAVITLFVRRKVGRWEALGIVLTGLIFAWVGTTYLSGFLPAGEGARGVAACLIGMLGWELAGRASAFIRTGRLPIIGKGGRDDGR